MTSRSYPRTAGSKRIFKGRVVDLRVDDVELGPEKTVQREVVDHPGAVVIVAKDAADRLLWVRQYRYAIAQDLLELPAGTLEEGEEPEACARRELVEETGHAAERWQEIGTFYTVPGFCTEYMHAFVAEGLSPASAEADEDEAIELVPLTLQESLDLIDSGRVHDAKSLAALHLYLRKTNAPEI